MLKVVQRMPSLKKIYMVDNYSRNMILFTYVVEWAYSGFDEVESPEVYMRREVDSPRFVALDALDWKHDPVLV